MLYIKEQEMKRVMQQALENDLLCPFHYFGITDLEIDGELDELTKFNVLTSDQRVKHIIERAEYYGFSGERVKGLVFCSNKKEAAELSQKFNQTGKYSCADRGSRYGCLFGCSVPISVQGAGRSCD